MGNFRDSTSGVAGEMPVVEVGHVFAVLGKIGVISCDAVVVPTDAKFKVEQHWVGVLALDVEADWSPDWVSGAVGLSKSTPNVYYVDVAPPPGEDEEWLGRQVSKVLGFVANAAVPIAMGRVRPLVAMPVFGTGEGGFRRRVGQAITAVLESAENMVRSTGIDVVVVTPHEATFAALQHVRRGKPPGSEIEPEISRLAELARSGQLAVFVGAGASIPSGLPSWSALLQRLSALVEPLPEKFEELGDLDKAEFIQRQLKLREEGSLGDQVVKAIKTDARPAIAHALLASLHLREAVTTNYDDLFEQATKAAGGGQNVVLPWSYPSQGEPWLLKLHGDVSRPDSIVLTRGSFVGFDRSARPAGAVFQALLLTKHMLFVGVSMTDDNVLRLLLEASAFVDDQKAPSRKIGTLLDVSHRPPVPPFGRIN